VIGLPKFIEWLFTLKPAIAFIVMYVCLHVLTMPLVLYMMTMLSMKIPAQNVKGTMINRVVCNFARSVVFFPLYNMFKKFLLTCMLAHCMASEYTATASTVKIGRIQWHLLTSGESLSLIARKFDIGYYELLEANPSIDPAHLTAGTWLRIPTVYLLPNVVRTGVVVNVPELRLYAYQNNRVLTAPIGIGRTDWETPLGQTTVLRVVDEPTWHAPRSIIEALKADGIEQPAVVPPGPDNPLGHAAIYLGLPGYLIHGTNKPFSVGRRTTSGCMRLYPEDIETLKTWVHPGTPVWLINMPVKLGWQSNQLYIEAHRPLHEDRLKISFDTWKQAVNAQRIPQWTISWLVVDHVLSDHLGIPEVVARTSLQPVASI
jgi:L,D-transpeptidase ErfK/SrfK